MKFNFGQKCRNTKFDIIIAILYLKSRCYKFNITKFKFYLRLNRIELVQNILQKGATRLIMVYFRPSLKNVFNKKCINLRRTLHILSWDRAKYFCYQ